MRRFFPQSDLWPSHADWKFVRHQYPERARLGTSSLYERVRELTDRPFHARYRINFYSHRFLLPGPYRYVLAWEDLGYGSCALRRRNAGKLRHRGNHWHLPEGYSD